ncbi:MAG: DUF6369 family protein, partial [Alphaproteobacteria bacterium]|nr:DUF6369 family protein [Alphaproteobacteria bacterium]
CVCVCVRSLKTVAIAAFLGMLATLNLATTAGEATLDQFRLREDNLRRAITAGATLSACLLVSFPLFQRNATTSATAALSYLLALATTLGTASRGLIFSIASSLAIAGRSRENTDHLSISPARVTIGAALAFGLLQLAVYFGDWRIVDSLSLDTLSQQLSTRISPATEILADFTLENWIFGKGIGTSFYIPWFRYRGLSPHSANLDNMYLTLIVKYGLLGGAVILRTFQIALTGQHSPIYKTQTTLLFLLIGLTSTPIYQPLILGFAAAQALAINQKYTTSGR